MTDETIQAIFARDEVAKYLDGSHGLRGEEARARVKGYLDELRTTQRYELYRALEYPLYPILRKLDRLVERESIPLEAAAKGRRIVYASNHRSHMDYLLELLVLDDAGLKPPIIAAGINLFGGPLGLIHRHVTGALPIRRNTKDPAYHITLKAYVAELLKEQDFFFYPEGGRSYSGELKGPKTGLFTACLQAEQPGLVIIPVSIAYDLILEDHVLARQKVKGRQRAFSREIAEMVRYAVGYRSRAFITFGDQISVDEFRRGLAPVGARPGPPGDAPHRRAHQSAADARSSRPPWDRRCRRRNWPHASTACWPSCATGGPTSASGPPPRPSRLPPGRSRTGG